MLGWRHVAEPVRAVHGRHGTADGRRDVVVAGTDVGHERPKHIERGIVAEALLELHVRGHLVERHVPRPLYDDLHARVPGALRELAQLHELGNLARVGGVEGAAAAHGVAERDGHVVLVQNLEDVVEALVEGVLAVRRHHEAEDEAATAAHDVGEALGLEEGVEDTAVEARVDRHEVDPVLGVGLDDLEDVVTREFHERLVEVADGIVDGDGPHHERCPLDELLAKRAGLARVGEVHDGVAAVLLGDGDLLPLLRCIVDVPRDAEVDVHLRAQARAHAARVQSELDMTGVRRYGDAARCDSLANELWVTALVGRDLLDLWRDNTRTRSIQLRHWHSLRWHYPHQVQGSGHVRVPSQPPRRSTPRWLPWYAVVGWDTTPPGARAQRARYAGSAWRQPCGALSPARVASALNPTRVAFAGTSRARGPRGDRRARFRGAIPNAWARGGRRHPPRAGPCREAPTPCRRRGHRPRVTVRKR